MKNPEPSVTQIRFSEGGQRIVYVIDVGRIPSSKIAKLVADWKAKLKGLK
jgi:hypothetical protein